MNLSVNQVPNVNRVEPKNGLLCNLKCFIQQRTSAYPNCNKIRIKIEGRKWFVRYFDAMISELPNSRSVFDWRCQWNFNVKLSIPYIETSAATGENVQLAVNLLLHRVMQRLKRYMRDIRYNYEDEVISLEFISLRPIFSCSKGINKTVYGFNLANIWRIIPTISFMIVIITLGGHDATANLRTLTKASVSYQSFDMLSIFARKY